MKPRVEEKVPQTEFVQPWEKAWALRETNHLTRDYRSLRRWQFINSRLHAGTASSSRSSVK